MLTLELDPEQALNKYLMKNEKNEWALKQTSEAVRPHCVELSMEGGDGACSPDGLFLQKLHMVSFNLAAVDLP